MFLSECFPRNPATIHNSDEETKAERGSSSKVSKLDKDRNEIQSQAQLVRKFYASESVEAATAENSKSCEQLRIQNPVINHNGKEYPRFP